MLKSFVKQLLIPAVLGITAILILTFVAGHFCEAFGEEPKPLYEKDIEGVLGPGDPHDLEIKKMEAYLHNLALKEGGQVAVGDEYQVGVVTIDTRDGLRLTLVEVLLHVPSDTSFVFELKSYGRGEIYIKKGRKRYTWLTELYEKHLRAAYEVAVVEYPDVYKGHPMVEWHLAGEG